MSDISFLPSPTGNSGGGGGTSSIRHLGGAPANVPSPYVPPSGAGGADTGNTPGTYEVQPFNPGETAANALQETEGGLAGLKNAIFGVSAPDVTGHHGGLVGDIPILGAGGRAISEAISSIGQTAGGVGHNVLAGIGGGLEHIDLNSDQSRAQIKAQFDALPDTLPGKAEAQDAIARDPGAADHYMSKVINEYNKEQLSKGEITGKPDFWTGSFGTMGSMAEVFDNILGGLGLTGKWAERSWTGLGTPGQGGMNRLQLIMAVGDGNATFNPDKGVLGTGALAGEQTSGLNSIEQIVYKHVKDGDWTPDQAMDFLAANNAGFSHSAVANIAGLVATDPQTWGSLGAAAIEKVGVTGARIVEAIDKASTAAAEADNALRIAREAGVQGERLIELTKAADAAHADLTAAQGAYKVGGDVSWMNVLGQAAHNEQLTHLVSNLYRTYEPLQAIHVDKTLKVARMIIDPLGAITLHNPFRKQALDLLGDDAAKTVIGAYGDGNHAGLIHHAADVTEGSSTAFADMLSKDLGVYAGNLTRRVIARTARDQAASRGALKQFVQQGINEVIAGVGSKLPMSWQEAILQEANRFRKFTWDEEAIRNLGARLADNYGIKEAEDWVKWIKDNHLTADQMGLLHAASYGRATRRVLAAVETARKMGTATGDLKDKLERLILINRTTLTRQGAEGILTRIENAGDIEKAYEEIEAAQKLYPELRGFTLDATDKARTVERFSKQLERKLPAFPSQVMDHELAGLPDDLRAIHNDTSYTLGFAPEDAYKWGVERANIAGGDLAPIHDVWVDHVADGLGTGYRTPGQFIEQNVAGQPILGAVAKRAGRTIDYIDAGIKTMGRRVSGALIAETARNRFVQTAAAKYGKAGITEDVAKNIMDRLEEAVNAQDIVVRPSGFSTHQMWEVAREAIPTSISKAEFGPRDVMDLVLDAYQGDMRYVGLTQALSSRIKRVLAFEGNNASVLAEQAYPILKYRLNVIFQAQEKIEPWVLNSLRGITPARSVRTMNEADRKTYALLERMAEKSLVSNADHEMAEQSAKVLYGKSLEQLAQDPTTAFGSMSKRLGIDWAALRDVKGTKQVNLLRTFRKGMGKELRKAWDQVEPGLFDDMYAEAVRKARRGVGGLDEDEFAVSVLSEQMLGNDIFVEKNADWLASTAKRFGRVDYKASVVPGVWSRPSTVGALQSLGLDDMTSLMGFTTKSGKVIRNEGELRAALAAGDITMDDVKLGLRRLNADPDYVRRVQSALEFNWPDFWDQVAKDFNLTPERRRYYEELIANAAELHDMSPIDYISQVMVPTIGEGSTDAVVGHLGKIINIMGMPKERSIEDVLGQVMHEWDQSVGGPATRNMEELARAGAPGYAIHGTTLDALKGIHKSGLKKESWFVPGDISGYGPVQLRVKSTHASLSGNSAADKYFLSSGAIPPSDIEFFGKDGQWHSLTEGTAPVIDQTQSLAHLRVGAAAGGTEEEFVSQLAHIFSAHLDPSAKKSLIAAFKPEMKQQMLEDLDISMDDINRAWTPEMEQQFVDHIMGEVRPTSLREALDTNRLRTIEDWNRVDPQQPVTLIDRSNDQPLNVGAQGLIGQGVRTAPRHVQHDVLPVISDSREMLPKLQLEHVDSVPSLDPYLEAGESGDGVAGVTVKSSHGESVLLNQDQYFMHDEAAYKANWERVDRNGEQFRTSHMVPDEEGNLNPRESFLGAAMHTGKGGAGTVQHEVAHVLDEQLTKEYKALKDAGKLGTKRGKQLQEYVDFRKRYGLGAARYRTSEYATANGFEGMAEILSLALHHPDDAAAFDHATQAAYDALKAGTGPQAAVNFKDLRMSSVKDFGSAQRYYDQMTAFLSKFDTDLSGNIGPQAERLIDRYGNALEELNNLDPEIADYAYEADQLIEEMRLAAKRLDVYRRELEAELRSEGTQYHFGLHRNVAEAFDPNNYQTVEQAVTDLRALLKKNGDLVDAPYRAPLAASDDPDVIRAVRMFGNWTNRVMADGIRSGPNAIHAGVLDRIAGIPTHQAVAHNMTEEQLWQTAVQSMKDKWDDAYRLQYYSRSRTMLERSINHPMFGIYPASYMWGKILPEMVKFMAQEPFGLRTGLPAYTYMDIQRAVALQREFDPEFDKKIEDTGHSAAFFALGYMLPSWPWEASSAFPGWSREFAQEGLDMQARVEAGQQVATKTAGTSGINLGEVAGKATDLINPVNPVDKAILRPLQEITGGNKLPEVPEGAYFDNQPGAVKAGDLGAPLTDSLQSLRSLFGG